MFKTVLLVDDNPSDLIIASAIVEQKDRRAVLAENASKALEIAEEEQINLFIVDLQMPHVGGIELIRQIRGSDKYKTTPILVMSAKGEIKDVQLAVKSGANDFVVKPLDHLIMEDKVKKLIGDAGEKWEEYSVRFVAPDCSGTIAKKFEIISLNEVGMTVESVELWSKDQVFEISSKLMLDRGIAPVQVRVDGIEGQQKPYKIKLTYLATTDVFRKQMRLLCRELWQMKKAA